MGCARGDEVSVAVGNEVIIGTVTFVEGEKVKVEVTVNSSQVTKKVAEVLGLAGGGYAVLEPPNVDAHKATVVAASGIETIAPALTETQSAGLNIHVITSAGDALGKFAVKPAAKIVDFKVCLMSLCNVDPWHQTLHYEQNILGDDLRWIDTAVKDTDNVILSIQPRMALDNTTVRKAVNDVCSGGKARKDAEIAYGHISRWETAQVTDMNRLFEYKKAFNENLSKWDVSNVNNMARMFFEAASFNGDLSGWNVGNVKDMSWMFYDAPSFNSNLSTWNVCNVTDMGFMFGRAGSFNGDLSTWSVGNVTNMWGMFQNAKAFNGDLSAWNVSNVTGLSYMFQGASSFNCDLFAWNVNSRANMNFMFSGAPISSGRKPYGT